MKYERVTKEGNQVEVDLNIMKNISTASTIYLVSVVVIWVLAFTLEGAISGKLYTVGYAINFITPFFVVWLCYSIDKSAIKSIILGLLSLIPIAGLIIVGRSGSVARGIQIDAARGI